MSELSEGIVIDNGSGLIKAGISGDDSPKSVFPSIIGRPKKESMIDQKDELFGEAA